MFTITTCAQLDDDHFPLAGRGDERTREIAVFGPKTMAGAPASNRIAVRRFAPRSGLSMSGLGIVPLANIPVEERGELTRSWTDGGVRRMAGRDGGCDVMLTASIRAQVEKSILFKNTRQEQSPVVGMSSAANFPLNHRIDTPRRCDALDHRQQPGPGLLGCQWPNRAEAAQGRYA